MNEMRVLSQVSEVVVYPDRARITAFSELDLDIGSYRIVVDELPLVLAPQSVRVSGRGEAAVRISSVDVARSFYEQTPVSKVRELEDQIQLLRDDLKVLIDEESILKAQGEYLGGLRKATAEYAKGMARGKTKVEDYAHLAEFLRTQDQELRSSLRDLAKRKREMDKQLNKLENELKELEPGRARQGYKAVIDLKAETAGGFILSLNYMVRKAGWRPIYDIRLEESDGRNEVDITILGEVTQNTGIDWAGVGLSVSTARPAISHKAPDLKPWYVDVYHPAPAPQPRQAFASSGQAITAVAEAAPPAAEEIMFLRRTDVDASMVTATLDTMGATATFHVEGKSDIPSDGSPHKTTLGEYSLDPEIDYLAIPKQVDAVYRRVKISNKIGSPLMAGNASLFTGPDFIGTVAIEYTAPGDELELLFGPEERITVERELGQREVEKTRLRDRREVSYGYEISFHNLLGEDAKIEVQDHIPVSRHEEIKVNLEEATPKPNEHSDMNIMKWQIVVPTAGKKSIQYSFRVTHPRNFMVVGLID